MWTLSDTKFVQILHPLLPIFTIWCLYTSLKDCIPDSFVDVVNLNTWSTLMIIQAKFATLSSLNFVHASCVQKFSQQIIKTKVFILYCEYFWIYDITSS